MGQITQKNQQEKHWVSNKLYKILYDKLEMKLEIFKINQIDLWFMIELPRHQICYHANAKQVKAV